MNKIKSISLMFPLYKDRNTVKLMITKSSNVLRKLKRKEFEGYSYDGAEASFELFIMDELAKTQEYFKLRSFQVVNEFKELKELKN